MVVVRINPEMLVWARETSGLTVDQAAEKLGLKPSTKISAVEKLLAIEGGEKPVSQGFLDKAVTTYRRPLIAFYLPKPPQRGERGEDFRAQNSEVSPRDNALLDALVRDVRARQQLVREILLEDDPDTQRLPFIAAASIKDGPRTVAAKIREALEIEPKQQKAAKDPASLFAMLRTAAERIGIYVLLIGDLGSHHSDIGEDVFRGFAIADNVAPFVAINDNDAVPARAFTLLHELAHLWVGASGISGPLQGTPPNKIERFCNEVAGEFLLPSNAFFVAEIRPDIGVGEALAYTARVAEDWNVSQGVVAYRLRALGLISEGVAGTLFGTLSARWRTEKQRVRSDRDADDRGPGFYVVRRSRLGPALLGVVRRALQGDLVTHTKAAKILGVSPSSVDPLLGKVA